MDNSHCQRMYNIMFLSLNRKIVYSILSLFVLLLLLFSTVFFTTYVAKIEMDQQISVQRNQQYSDLLYRVINLSKEVQLLLQKYPEIGSDKGEYTYLHALTNEERQFDILLKEQNMIIERSKAFDAQYATINNGIMIIAGCVGLMTVLLLFIAYLVKKIIFEPIQNISKVTNQISLGNWDIRIPVRGNVRFKDELDSFALIFNQMLDNLQRVVLQVRQNEKFLQALIDSIPDGIRVIDENYRIVLANKAYYKQSGGGRKKCQKCHESSFKSKYPCSRAGAQCPLDEILQNGKASINLIQQFSGNPAKHLAVNAAPLVYDNKKKYVIESIRDLSEDISFSHQQKVSSLGFLSSSIAHEIKNQLGALRIIMEHLIDKYYAGKSDESDEKKMIMMLHSELVNAIDVPERLLKLTRKSAGSNTEIDCAAAISDVLALMDFEAKSKGIGIVFSNSAKNTRIVGNEADFKIAAINIVQNALKAMPDKGALTIGITSSKSELKIDFADTGIGIAEENLNNIFTPFFSEGRQMKSDSGSGLGLAITKSIVEKLGGQIKVTSVEGKGSCFSFCFPLNKKLAKK